MSASVTVDTSGINRRLAQLAILGRKGIAEAVKDGAKRFAYTAVKNTQPMSLETTPALAKAEWQGRVTHYFETHRLTKKGYRKYAEVKRLLAAKKKRLGRQAAGWNAAVSALGSKAPAWVKRHGESESACHIRIQGDRVHIILTNKVPYNETMTHIRARFALRRVERGFDANLRVLKRKLLRKVR